MNNLIIATICLLLSVSANTYYQDEVYEAAHPRKHFHATKARDNQDETLFVHFIAHTHDDVGWLKTVDEYYVGGNQGQQHAEVNLILTTVVQELMANPARKFTYVEMKFFTMWYNEQTEEVKGNVRTLIAEGRFEFVNAGWSMHDEATPHYEDMINNMMIGHEFL